MPKTESELWDWVVEYNRSATHDRGLTSNYGYQSILDVDLVAVCAALREQFSGPIRVLDVGCGNGWALKQLQDRVTDLSLSLGEFEFWGMGLNRYEKMWISDDRLITDGLNAHDFAGMQFHLIISVFAFHYFWHKLEALEKIHNLLLVDGGEAYLHFPGYLVRFGESDAALEQREEIGNRRFGEFLQEREASGGICPMHFRTIPHYSDDDDCALLAEFGHVRFRKQPRAEIHFGHVLHAFALFTSGFSCQQMNESKRIYVASHYETTTPSTIAPSIRKADGVPGSGGIALRAVQRMPAATAGSPSVLPWRRPYRITSIRVPTEIRPLKVDVAVHENDSDRVVLICPGACEPLAGRVVNYSLLADKIIRAGLGAVVRYNDPYDSRCNYADFLLAKMQRVLELTLNWAPHFCSTAKPRLQIMAYSSSAGAAAALAAEYKEIESLLLVAPSYDVPQQRVLAGYSQFDGHVRVLAGDCDQVVLPEQAYWYYENASRAASREYVEIPGCGHTFAGPHNKAAFLDSPQWAFGQARPRDFPPKLSAPSEAWR